MPRPRLPENRGLPARWRFTHSAYYYQVPPGLESRWDGKKLYRLGKTLAEAYRSWAAMIELSDGDIQTIAQLLDRYALEVVPLKAPKTQASNQAAIKRLRAVFGSMRVSDLTPQHAYQYRDKRGRSAPTAANRELEVLSHSLTKAVEWGVIKEQPLIKGAFRKLTSKPRTRYVEDWEIVEALQLSSKRHRGSVQMIQAYIRLKLLTGLRRSDLLRLTMSDIHEDGIHVTPHKTAGSSGKRIVIEWNDDLHNAVKAAKANRSVNISPFLFCNAKGQGYIDEDTGTANGWDSMWQRFMVRVLNETKVTERFTEHDLRAKAGSDAESLEHARALLAHASDSTTKRIYRRKAERVKPSKGV